MKKSTKKLFLDKRAVLKLLLFMNLKIFFLFMCVMPASANIYSQHTKLNVSVENYSLEDVFEQIENQSEFTFLYSVDDIDDYTNVSVDIKGKSVEEVLDKCLTNTSLIYEIEDKLVVVRQKENTVSQKVVSQEKKKIISGKVTDDTGSPLPGVSVVIKGTSIGTATDIDGNFVLETPEGTKVVIVSFIGMIDKEVELGKKSNFNIVLQANTENIDEVVIIGYGSQKKESIVSSLSSITTEKLKAPSGNLTNNLAGKVPGLIAIQRSGEPGYDNSEFWIRGISSFKGGTTPLVLVDGVPRAMRDIESDEIESFTLLKDAAATAVYGAEGANGVILITSKRGQVEKTRISFRVEYNSMTPTRLPRFLNAEETLNIINEGENNMGNPDKFSEEFISNFGPGNDNDLYPDVNWLDMLRDHTSSKRYTMNVRGGTEKAKYFVSGAYFTENGIFKSNALTDYETNIGLNRYNLRSNVDLNISETTLLSVDLSGQYKKTNYPGYGSSTIFRTMARTPVFLFPMVYSDGTTAGHPRPSSNRVNPYNLLMNSGYAKEWRTAIQSKVAVNQKLDIITPGLSAKASISFDANMAYFARRSKNPSRYIATGRDADGELLFNEVVQGSDDLSGFSNSSSGGKKIYFETSINYTRLFSEKHQVGGMLLYMQKESQSNNNPLAYRKQGIVGRATYGYDSRYFLEANFGYTGSETFAKNNRFGFFPAVGLGWYLSNENFYSEALRNVVPKLKLRASIGRTGNDNTGGARFLYRGTMNTGAGGYNIGYNDNGTSGGVGNGIVEGRFSAPYLSWEIEDKQNYGIDIGLFGNRIDIQLDYFSNKRYDILLQRNSVSNVTGFQQMPWQNYGEVANKGFDGSVTLNQTIGDLKLSAIANFTFARNEIKEYDQIPQKYPWMNKVGTRLNSWDLYIAQGLYTKDDFTITGDGLDREYTLKEGLPVPTLGGIVKPGDIKYRDLNGDGKIDNFDRKVDAANPSTPEVVYGFGLNAEYKGFYAGIFFQGAGNTSTVLGGNNSESFMPFKWGFDESSLRREVLDRWTEENPSQNVMFPRLSTTSKYNNTVASTWWVRDASFIRLKNIEIGYNVSQAFLKKIHLSKLRIYAMGNNIAVWDKIKMWDPEQGNANGGFNYPLPTTYTMGIECSF